MWNDGTFDGEILIQSGGELHWTGTVDVKEDSNIVVEDGGVLHLDSVHFQGENTASTLLIYDGTEIDVSEEIQDSAATMTIYFNTNVPESAYLNLTIDDVTSFEITGESESFTVDLSQTVNIVVDHYYPFQLGITHIELFHSNSELLTLSANELTQQGGNVIWNQASFNIENHGTLIIEDSTITGANITCEGDCTIEDSTLYGSGPIHVMDGSHLDVLESVLLGTRTDEDIILHDQATIDYTNSTGTGGFVDAWIRLLSMRELVVNAPTATVVATGIGYGSNTINTIINGDPSDASTWKVDIGTSEHKRIVEWLDGSGTYGQESGTIKVTVATNWGEFEADATAPQTSTATIDVVYPQLRIDNIEPEAVTAETGRSLGMMVTISNTGPVAVNPNVRCYVGETEADTTANTANWAVEPGQTKDVPITWYHYSDEAVQLTCDFLYPDVLEPVKQLIATESGTTSSEVSWTTDEVEGFPIILYVAIVLVVAILAAATAIGARKEIAKQDVVETLSAPEENEEWVDSEGNPVITTE
tara:strand:- start:15146 stop:16741 length:1596 start_codon:yes stop_codon:yes gene_type:complete